MPTRNPSVPVNPVVPFVVYVYTAVVTLLLCKCNLLAGAVAPIASESVVSLNI
jgi:hypothetical protein